MLGIVVGVSLRQPAGGAQFQRLRLHQTGIVAPHWQRRS
jgi:hypothetical protein